MRTPISAEVRKLIFAASDGKCFYCGSEAEVIDHIVPVVYGGSGYISNLVASCDKCNRVAGRRKFHNVEDKRLYILSAYLCTREYSMGIFNKRTRAKSIIGKMIKSGIGIDCMTRDTAVMLLQVILDNGSH